MRNAKTAALLFGVLINLVANGWAQEKSVQTSANEPLQIIDDCIRAIQQRDFARYVDHLSEAEQKLQAGYALILSIEVVPQVDAGSQQIEPEILLLMRAVGDVIKEHIKSDLVANVESSALNTVHQLLLTQLMAIDMPQAVGAYSIQQPVKSPNRRDVLIKSAEKTLKDPRLFLIATLTEYSRPILFTGTAPVKKSELPDLNELANEYQQHDWTLYTRGNYAIAVAVPRESAPRTEIKTPEKSPSQVKETPSPLRVEFQKINGVWKISHLLPMPMFTPSTNTAAAGYCSGPECKAPIPNSIVPPPALPYPGPSAQAPFSLPTYSPR